MARERILVTVKTYPTLSRKYGELACGQSKHCFARGLDWECGALYWKCLKSSGGDEPEALAKVRAKYLDTFRETDLHFFLGTLRQFHGVSPNPWVIVGVFPIPHQQQTSFL